MILHVSKIETGGRNASKDRVLGIAEFLETDKQELLTLWLANRIHELIQDVDYALNALELVKKKFLHDNRRIKITSR